MLVAFPIGFLCGGIVFDVLSRALERETFYTTAYHCLIAGIVTGFVAAIPGLVDLLSVVSSTSAARRVGLMHMTVNTSALLLFMASVLMRPSFVDRTIISIVPAYLGLILLGIGGWLGGSLVYEHHVGVEVKNERKPEAAPRPPESRWRPSSGEYDTSPPPP
jgi:uncharacterized membrane protein